MVNYYQASFEILSYKVDGIVNIEDGVTPEATVLYTYDAETDPNRSDIVVDGSTTRISMGNKTSNKIGICVARDKILSVTGTIEGVKNRDFSLFAGMAVHTSTSLGNSKIREKYRFQYGMIGCKVDYYDKVFRKAEFSFNLFNENAEITDSVLSEIEHFDNVPENRMVWKTKLSEGVFLSLSKRFNFISEPSRSYLQRELYFTLESQEGLSLQDILDDYIEPIRSLFSISLCNSESIRYVSLSQSDSMQLTKVISPDFVETSDKIDATKCLFNPGSLSKNNYANWIVNFKKVEYMSGLLELSFNASNIEYILGRMLPQIEQLFFANSQGSQSTNDFIKQVQHLLNDNERMLKDCGFLNSEVDRSVLAARIKNCRTYWIHGAILSHYPPAAADELIGILNIVTFVYVLEVLKNTKLHNCKLIKPSSPQVLNMSNRFQSGYNQWRALDLTESQARRSLL